MSYQKESIWSSYIWTTCTGTGENYSRVALILLSLNSYDPLTGGNKYVFDTFGICEPVPKGYNP
jgi:hypothetical protein